MHTHKTIPFPRFVEGDPEPFGERIPLRRGIIHVRVESPDLGEVDVLTMHFKSNLPVLFRSTDGREVPDTTPQARAESALRSLIQRAAEAVYVRGLVDDVFRALPDHAVCVLGDLNDGIDSLPVRIVRGLGAPSGEPSKELLTPCAELLAGGPSLLVLPREHEDAHRSRPRVGPPLPRREELRDLQRGAPLPRPARRADRADRGQRSRALRRRVRLERDSA